MPVDGLIFDGRGEIDESMLTGESVPVEKSDGDSVFAVVPSVAPDGTLTYTPADDAFGSSTFDVQVQDDGGTPNGGDDTSIVQTFTITVGSVNGGSGS